MDAIYLEKETFNVHTRIFSSSESFPGHLPPISKDCLQIRDHVRYVDKKVKDICARYQRNRIDMCHSIDVMHNILRIAEETYGHLLTSYDKEVVMPSTCAVGLWRPASSDLEVLGYVGMKTDFTYPEELIIAVEEYYKKYYSDCIDDLSISLPRGKTIGFPFMVGGMNRQLNSTLLSVAVALALGGLNFFRTDQLSSLYRWLFPYHGAPFSMEGFRLQHSEKNLPIQLKDGLFSSFNFEPRFRIINMESKLSVVVMRQDVKKLTRMILSCPIHSQARSVITDRIQAASRRGWKLISTDYSKFDFHHGGARGMQIAGLQSRILHNPEFLKSAQTVADTRLFVSGYSNLWQMPGDRLLKSGAADTSVRGCMGNFIGTVGALHEATGKSYKTLIDSLGSYWDLLAWGDDAVVMLSDPSIEADFLAAYDRFDLSVTTEPTVKFLGSNYERGDFSGSFSTGYSLGRAMQQMFFPERGKEFPFNLVGYIARLEMMGPAALDFHTASRRIWHFLFPQTPYFKFEERSDVLMSLIPIMERRAASVSALDDVFQLFSHGLNSNEYASEIEVPEYFSRMLGLVGSARIDDPAQFLSEESINGKFPITQSLLKDVDALANGRLESYQRIIYFLTKSMGLTYDRGSVFY